jgi:hypothetical protein
MTIRGSFETSTRLQGVQMTDPHGSEPAETENKRQKDAARTARLDQLQANISELQESCERCNKAHEAARRRIAIAAVTVSLVATAGAGLGTITVITKSTAVATILAIVTLIATGVNSIFKPAERAAGHSAATVKFRDILWTLRRLLEDVPKQTMQYVEIQGFDPESGKTYDAGYYEEVPASFQASLLDNLIQRFRETEDKYREAIDSAPPIKGEACDQRLP